MAAAAVETHDLEKTCGTGVQALTDLDLRVDEGEVFGYLGPERRRQEHDDQAAARPDPADGGAGVRARARPTRHGVEARRRIGYLPGDLRLADRLTAREQLDSLARLRGGVDVELRNDLCERFGVVLDRSIRHLSKGNRQKVGLVQAFMHRPDLVVLDELARSFPLPLAVLARRLGADAERGQRLGRACRRRCGRRRTRRGIAARRAA